MAQAAAAAAAAAAATATRRKLCSPLPFGLSHTASPFSSSYPLAASSSSSFSSPSPSPSSSSFSLSSSFTFTLPMSSSTPSPSTRSLRMAVELASPLSQVGASNGALSRLGRHTGGSISSRRRPGGLHVVAVGWDPEGILAAPQPGHIARRQMQKQMSQEDMEKQKLDAEAQREAERRRIAREARAVPEGDAALVDYLLAFSNDAAELEYEVARCRARLGDDFFRAISQATGSIRFAVSPTPADQERLSALEKLRDRLEKAIAKYDELQAGLLGAKARLQTLLAAPNKRDALLAMAANNELDSALLTLLDENIAAARRAQQTDVADFMEKIRGGVVKYMTKA